MYNNKISVKRLLLLGLASVVITTTTSVLAASDTKITLEKIMSDPSWIGHTPQAAAWLPDSRHVVYQQKQDNSVINKQFRLDTSNINSVKNVAITEYHKTKLNQTVYNIDKTLASYVFEGDIYLWNTASSQVQQITSTSDYESSPQFLTDGRLGYWESNRFISYDLATKSKKELFKIALTDKPEAPKGPQDIIAEEQHKLIQYVAKQHVNSKERFENKVAIKKTNKFVNNSTFYFGEGNVVSLAKVAPTGDKAIVVVQKRTSWRGEGDVMPNYIADDGRIEIEKVRRRVADAKPVQQEFWFVDLSKNEKFELKINNLPDYDKDVLAKIKTENFKAEGKKYESKKAPRTINLLQDWTWDQGAVVWHNSGKNVAIMLEAWDNKDRWLVTVDFKNNKLIPQHQLHDEAWINYTFNQFGWFNKSNKLYYLSEQSGYSHVYTKDLATKKVIQRTSGDFEVSSLVLTSDDSHFYFRANINHPGEYHVYQLSTAKTTEPKALTTLIGENTFKLSPDETKLLVEHSSLLRPTELFLIDLSSNKTQQLTDTVSQEFISMPWVKPEIIAVPSSHTDKPIYARVYMPKNVSSGSPRKAVIFNHGAGYLQNSHKGWSGYFREFMFHSMLAQQGYVVMDMDYRASKGYGRDWRTAIYRQMGTPEIQDLVDGVDWLVKNANVDRQRIGTYGGSYGGFMTFMALFKEPELFQAGAALRPVSDWAHYNDGCTSNILNRPVDDMIAYRRSSPIYFAEGLQKPLLINAPMVDDNVFFVDVVRLVQRFIELEKQDFETAIYPVEPHGFVQPSSWLDEYRRIYKLFEQNL